MSKRPSKRSPNPSEPESEHEPDRWADFGPMERAMERAGQMRDDASLVPEREPLTLYAAIRLDPAGKLQVAYAGFSRITAEAAVDVVHTDFNPRVVTFVEVVEKREENTHEGE